MKMENSFKKIIGSRLLILFFVAEVLCLLPKKGDAQPAVIESGMTPAQVNWVFETPCFHL